MKIMRLSWLIPLSMMCAVACSSSSNSGTSNDNDAGNTTHADGGAGGNGIGGGGVRDASAGHDAAAAAAAAAAATDAGHADAGVVNLEPFAFVLGGQTRTLSSMRVWFADQDCANEIFMTAGLVPVGDEENDPSDPPELQLAVCVDNLSASGDAPYGITSDDTTLAQLQFQFLTPSVAHFPIADGPGIHVVQDGKSGTFAMTATGTFDLGSSSTPGTPFTLAVQQPVTN